MDSRRVKRNSFLFITADFHNMLTSPENEYEEICRNKPIHDLCICTDCCMPTELLERVGSFLTPIQNYIKENGWKGIYELSEYTNVVFVPSSISLVCLLYYKYRNQTMHPTRDTDFVSLL